MPRKKKITASTKVKSTTGAQVAISVIFLGGAMLAAAGMGMRLDPRVTESNQLEREAAYDRSQIENSRTLERGAVANADLEVTSVEYNGTKNFVDFDRYNLDVITVTYRNVGQSQNTKPLQLSMEFDRSLHLALDIETDEIKQGVLHVTDDAEYELMESPADALAALDYPDVVLGEGSVVMKNSFVEVMPENNKQASMFVFDINRKQSEGDSKMNIYDLKPGEFGQVHVLIPKFFSEEIEPFDLEITAVIDSGEVVSELSEINNERTQPVDSKFLNSESVYCLNFSQCTAAFFGTCSQSYLTESACEAALDEI